MLDDARPVPCLRRPGEAPLNDIAQGASLPIPHLETGVLLHGQPCDIPSAMHDTPAVAEAQRFQQKLGACEVSHPRQRGLPSGKLEHDQCPRPHVNIRAVLRLLGRRPLALLREAVPFCEPHLRRSRPRLRHVSAQPSRRVGVFLWAMSPHRTKHRPNHQRPTQMNIFDLLLNFLLY